MSFTPPLPPPLPDWPPFSADDDRASLLTSVSLLRRAQPPLPPTPPPGLDGAMGSFGALGLIRSCDDNLRRMSSTLSATTMASTSAAPPPGFGMEPRHQLHLASPQPAFGRSELNASGTIGSSSGIQWGRSASFGEHMLSSSHSASHWGVSPAEIERKAVEILVDKTFGTDAKVNGALVDWIDDPIVKWHLSGCFQNLRRDAIAFRDGTSFKNDYDILIARLAAFFMDVEPPAPDSSIEKKLASFFLQRVAITKGDEYFVKRFIWACDGVRIIADAASRTGNLGLSDDEVRDLCACVRSLMTALPPIARQLEVAKRLGPVTITDSIGSLTVSASTSRSTTPTTSPVVSPSLSAKKDLKEADQATGNAPSSWASVVTTAPVRPPVAANAQPVQEAEESYQFFEEAPELDGMKRVQVFRLKRHCTLQPKATLCPPEVSNMADHNPQTCPHSHSLLEVMTYSPLFKLFVCNDDQHYGEDAHERRDCAFLHVDVGFKKEWMDDFAKGKRSYCASGSKCVNRSCLKSHCFAEMCWYNPWYKIQRCERGCTETSLGCRFFHEGSGDRRYLELDDDHVGHAIEIPFVTRTHDALIKKLKSVGL